MDNAAFLSLVKSIHRGTPGTGMKDDVPAVIQKAAGGPMGGNEGQPAALSEGEYVIPADVVGLLGDGNSSAGAKILEQFMKQIRMSKGKHLAKGNQAPPFSK